MVKTSFCFLLGALSLLGATQVSLAAPPLGSVGRYYNGCLDSQAELQPDSPGLLKILTERDRAYANQTMVDFLVRLGQSYRAEYPKTASYERLQIGDVSQEYGGEVGLHHSHQVGLDADLIYFRNDHRETEPSRGRDASMDEDFVVKGKITENFDLQRNWWLFEYAYASGQLDRMFVDREIKRYYCKHAKEFEPSSRKRRAILTRMRPAPFHDDHVHVRLKCPKTDHYCKNSSPPEGLGCGRAELNAALTTEQAIKAETRMAALGHSSKKRKKNPICIKLEKERNSCKNQ